MSNWPKDADPLTLAIQHLNSTPYALTKDECVDVLRKLRGGAEMTADEQVKPADEGRLERGVRPLSLDVPATEAARRIARALFALGESCGAPCSRIAFKLGTYPDKERDGGGFSEKPLADFIARELDRMELLARNEPAA